MPDKTMIEGSVIEVLENLKGAAAYYIDKPEEQALTTTISLIKELQELKKHDCQRWMEEGAGCSICSRTNKLTKEELREVQEHINWRISELNKELRETKTVLECWYKIFGTTQLTHAKDRLEVAEGKVNKLEKELQGMREFLEKISKKGEEMLAICERENFIFDNLEDRWQKLAFTFYSEIVQLSSDAHSICHYIKGGERKLK